MTKRALAVLAIVCIMVALAWSVLGQQQPRSGRGAWEYRTVPVENISQGEQVLKDLGEQGWELTAVQTLLRPEVLPANVDLRPGDATSAIYFFKRRK